MNQAEEDSKYLSTLTVLYVEDVPVVREFTRHVLAGLVGELIVATDGPSGLAAFRERRPPIVITDIVMPDGDGLTMAAAIRTLDPGAHLIVTTAYDNTEFLKRAIELGVEKYVFKPTDPEELKKSLLLCAHQLSAEEQLNRKRQMDAQALREEHREVMRGLARGIGHDFNNLIQGILGAISVARLSTPPANQLQGILELAERSANQARELGRRLIFMAKGGGELKQCGHLGPLIRSTVETALKGSSITWSFDIPEDLPPVKHDEQEMRTLMELVVANAREAMPSGGDLIVQERLCTEDLPESLGLMPDTYVGITFRDSGHGIPEEILGRIFDPYFTTKGVKNQKGVGLSLTICQSIARSHGGALQAESTVGRGAAFHLFLPVAEPPTAS
jgi:signal transduction histidine kinase